MKDRLFKILLAVIIVIGVLPFSACDSNTDKGNNNSTENVEDEIKKPAIPEGVYLEDVQSGTEVQLFEDFFNRLNSSQNATLSVYSRVYYYDMYLTFTTDDDGKEVEYHQKHTKEELSYGSYGYVADSSDSPQSTIVSHYKYDEEKINDKNIAEGTYSDKYEYECFGALLNGNIYSVISRDYNIGNTDETVHLSDLRGVRNASYHNYGHYSAMAGIPGGYGDILLREFWANLENAASYAESKNIEDLYYVDSDEVFENINYFNFSVKSFGDKLYINIDYQLRGYHGSGTKTVEKILYMDLNAGITKDDLPKGEVKPEEIKEKCTDRVIYLDCNIDDVFQDLKAGKNVTLTALGGGDLNRTFCSVFVATDKNYYLTGENCINKEYNIVDGKFIIKESDFNGLLLADCVEFSISLRYDFLCESTFLINNF